MGAQMAAGQGSCNARYPCRQLAHGDLLARAARSRAVHVNVLARFASDLREALHGTPRRCPCVTAHERRASTRRVSGVAAAARVRNATRRAVERRLLGEHYESSVRQRVQVRAARRWDISPAQNRATPRWRGERVVPHAGDHVIRVPPTTRPHRDARSVRREASSRGPSA